MDTKSNLITFSETVGYEEHILKRDDALDEDTPPSVRRAVVPEIKSIDVDERTVTHVISSNAIDRDGDIVEPLGWDLASFKRNPVVLADHSYTIGSIVGRAEKIEKSPKGLVATTRFDELGLGAQAFRLIAEGFLRAFSVGFKPTKAHSVRNGADAKCKSCVRARDLQVEGKTPEEVERTWIKGTHFLEQELLEYSAVAIPANPDAVLNAVKSGAVKRENIKDFFSPYKLIFPVIDEIEEDAPDPRAAKLNEIAGLLDRDSGLAHIEDVLKSGIPPRERS